MANGMVRKTKCPVKSDVAVVDDPLYFALCLLAHNIPGDLAAIVRHVYESSHGNADRAIDFLADELQVPVDIVARFYKAERTKLEVGAQVTGFFFPS